MPARTVLVICALLYSSIGHAQTLTLAGGQTVFAKNSEHNAYRAEINFGWKPEIWSNDSWTMSLNHALSVINFRDLNNVTAVSWAPNIIFTPNQMTDFSPYIQLSLGAAYLSDDQFDSEGRPHPCNCREGVTDMGSHGQFESSIAIGMIKERFSIRAKLYHYSNANIANENEGIDVAEFGIGYTF
jgi:Lipid A 3-O-deacylase (PagL)